MLPKIQKSLQQSMCVENLKVFFCNRNSLQKINRDLCYDTGISIDCRNVKTNNGFNFPVQNTLRTQKKTFHFTGFAVRKHR